MTEPAWSRRARRRIQGQRLVLIGIGVDQMRGFVEAGADVVGAVAVLPAGGPAAVFDESFPVLVLQGTSRDILTHVVGGYAAAIGRAESDVAHFLDDVDPDRSAAVTGYLPIPHAALNGRQAWTADSAISTVLEAKVGAATPLAGTVRVIPTIPLPSGSAHDWWHHVCEQFDADRLVIQSGGLSGGGTGTFICDEPAGVPPGISGFVSPFVDGLPANVMGVVDDAGTTLVLPASRQLLRSDDHGSPLYAGNVTGEHWVADRRDALADEVRAIGRSLAAAGFFGPFGVDFIIDADGRRWFHDLNPRMNGVLDSLVHLLADSPMLPLAALMLSRPQWTEADVAQIEDDLHRAAAATPIARLWLTAIVDGPTHVTQPPQAGRYLITLPDLAVSLVDESALDERRGGQVVALLEPLLPPGLDLVPGDRLALGNLYCDAVVADELSAAGPALIDAFLAS